MTTNKTRIFQIQSIAEKTFKQELNQLGQPCGAISKLVDWRVLSRQAHDYPQQLYEFLFGNGEDLITNTLVLQLMSTSQLCSIKQVLGIPDDSFRSRSYD